MYTQVASNKRKSILLVLLFVILVTALGYLFGIALGRPNTVIFVGIFAVVYALISYHFSAQLALQIAGAQPVTKQQAPELYRIVENLAIAAGLPMPKVYVMNDPTPNAFATGRDPRHAVVAVTTGIMEILEKDELEGVIAHELSHVGNYDIRFMAVVMVLVTVVSLIADWFLRWSWFSDDDEGSNPIAMGIALVTALLAPIVATLLQLAVSRKREYLADASGALLTRYPEGLARALEKIAAVDRPTAHASTATAHMYFSNPLSGKGAGLLANLFSTHPPIQERIKRLQEMEGKV